MLPILGLIYYNFDRATSVVKAEDDGGVLHIGMDLNDPMSCVVALRKGNSLICIDEIVIYGSNTDEMVKEIHQRYPNRQIIIYPDPAARQRKTSAGGRTDLSILQNAGFMTKARSAHPAVRDRINSVNSRLKSGSGERHLFFTDKCKQAIKSLERQTYKEGTSQPIKMMAMTICNDALGYMVEYSSPLKQIIKSNSLRGGLRWQTLNTQHQNTITIRRVGNSTSARIWVGKTTVTDRF